MSSDPLRDNEIGSPELPAEDEKALANSNENLWKVILIGIAFLILFSAFNSASVLITPIYEQLGYNEFGKISTLCIYIAFAFNDFLAPFELKTVGLRLGLFLGAIGYVIFMLGGLQLTACHYRFEGDGGFCSSASILTVNVFASIACGISAAILWLAMAKYIDCCANKYNKGKFFGAFWAIFQMSFILGNVLGAYLLSLFDPFIYFISMGSLVVFASISLLFLPPVRDAADEQEITRPMFEDIKFRIRGIKRITFMKAFRPLLPYFLFSGFSVAIYSTFPQRIINLTLGDAPTNVKNEKIEWCYVGQGIMSVINSFLIGKAFDTVGIKKSINVSNFGFIFSMVIAVLATYYLQYGLALAMVVVWAFGDSSIRTLSNAIIAKDFKGRLEAFAATRVITEIGVVFGLLISIGLGDVSPYYFIGTIVGVTVVMQILVLFYDTNAIDPKELEGEEPDTNSSKLDNN